MQMDKIFSSIFNELTCQEFDYLKFYTNLYVLVHIDFNPFFARVCFSNTCIFKEYLWGHDKGNLLIFVFKPQSFK